MMEDHISRYLSIIATTCHDCKQLAMSVTSHRYMRTVTCVQFRMSVKTLLLLWLLVLPVSARTSELDPDYQGESAVSAVSGTRALLPCDLKSPLSGDNVYLVLWYRTGSGLPIYTLDARRVDDLTLADHRADDPSLGRRAYFLTVGEPPSLSIENPDPLDEGVYICRVDFRESPTRYTRVNLTIIIPPKSIKIVDHTGTEVTSVIGPYNEGQPLQLVCLAAGGRPAPRVLWFLQSSLLDDTYHQSKDLVVKNELLISNLGREYLMTKITCQANNNNQTVPLYARVTLDLNLPPLTVEMMEKDSSFSAGREYTLTCKAMGSRPPATITWWKGKSRVNVDATPVVSPDGTTATSRLSIKIDKTDDGRLIKCRAINEIFPHIQLEDGTKLQVHYPPEVSISLGSSLNARDIKVGDDVYFECHVIANPPIYRLIWLHQGKKLRQNIKSGIIMSNQSLVVQSLTRRAGGTYQCVADNLEGQAASHKLHLDIKYPPECIWNRQPTYAVALQENTEVECRVDADPPQVKFKWAFNSTGGFTKVPSSTVGSEGTISLLRYTPTTGFHFGKLLCWGENSVGKQKKPCVFHIIQAGPPEPLMNCTLGNETWNSIQVSCVSGYDGGVPQVFILELYEGAQLQLNLTSSTTPNFLVQGLRPNAHYTAIVYAANRKGRSQKIRLEGDTTFAVEKRTGGAMAVLSVSPVLASLIGVIAGLVIAALVVAACIRTGRSKRGMKRLSTKPTSQTVPPPQLADAEDKNPDVVPYNNITDFPDKRFVRHYPETSSFPEMNPYQKINNLPTSSSPTYSETDL